MRWSDPPEESRQFAIPNGGGGLLHHMGHAGVIGARTSKQIMSSFPIWTILLLPISFMFLYFNAGLKFSQAGGHKPTFSTYLNHLVVVPGHSVLVNDVVDVRTILDPSNWYMEAHQQKSPQ